MLNVPPSRPLDGIKVLEVGQLLAGPFVGCLLGYYGAEVIKVEPPGEGDPIRKWRVLDENGTSYWWRSLARNKKCITADLRQPEGRELVKSIAGRCDVLVENFRPGTMEKWGLGPDELQADNPRLVYTRISGYGQDGPWSGKPGFASVCEGVGGFRYVNGKPGEAPMRHNLSLGDTLAGLQAAMGVLMAILHRERSPQARGQVIDMALYEAVFNLLEAVVPEYDGAGVIREPSGSTLTGIVPTNTYRCADGKFIIIGANGDSLFKRLCETMGQPEMGEDPRFANNAGRVEHEAEIDARITEWTASLPSQRVLDLLEEARVPSGPILNVADMMRHEHFNARGLFEEVEVDGSPLKVPAILPKLSDTPGRTDWAGPDVGAFNDEIYRQWLGLSEDEMAKLRARAVI